MSPSNINSFVGDLVQMAQAMEQLPKVEAERDELKINLDRALDTVQSRELRIIDLNATIAELNNKVRSLEVERDDASFRVLEAEDREHNVLNTLRTVQIALGQTVDALDPPKPEPETEPQGSSVVDPTSSQIGSSKDTLGDNSIPEVVHSISEVQPQGQSVTTPTEPSSQIIGGENTSSATGQSENPPTASTGQMETAAPLTPAPDTDAGLTTKETLSVDHGLGPYFGKRYDAQPAYINFNDWLAGGGTEADYFWRPDRESGSTF